MEINNLIGNVSFGEDIFRSSAEEYLIQVTPNNYSYLQNANNGIKKYLIHHKIQKTPVLNFFNKNSTLSYIELDQEKLSIIISELATHPSVSIFFKEDMFELIDENIEIVRPENYLNLIPCENLFLIKQSLLEVYLKKMKKNMQNIGLQHKCSIKHLRQNVGVSHNERQEFIRSFPIEFTSFFTEKENEFVNDLLFLDNKIEHLLNLTEIVNFITKFEKILLQKWLKGS